MRSKNLSYAQLQQAERLIREHANIITEGSTRLVHYHPQWDDARVAQEMMRAIGGGTHISKNSIERFRKTNLGILINRNAGSESATNIGSPTLRIAMQARQRVDNLEPRMSDCEDLLRAVCGKLGIALPAHFGEGGGTETSAGNNDADAGSHNILSVSRRS